MLLSAACIAAIFLVGAHAYPELKGMTVFGYQGWYTIDRDSSGTNFGPHTSNYKWFDPANDVTPGPPTGSQRVLTDPLPYTAEYPSDCLLPTNFILANGEQAQFFSSYCVPMIEKHFQWMVEYKIDGLFVQRFFDSANPTNEFYDSNLMVLNTVRDMAEKYNKYFAVEYDFSGKPSTWSSADYASVLEKDYTDVLLPIFNSPSYIYQDNRPVLEIWGAGINEYPNGPRGTVFGDIVDMYHAKSENPWIVLGIPHQWLNFKDSTKDTTGYFQTYQKAECLQPWPVGAFSSVNDLRGALQNELLPGKQQTDEWGIEFGGAFTPGGSNRNPSSGSVPFGNRYNGTFYEESLRTFSNTTIKPFFNFGAMFDEYTERTQILPMLHNSELPTDPNPGFWGTDDDMDIFWYMNVSGQYTAAFHRTWGQEPLSP